MSRIVWLSNVPWAASGYGEQTALFTPRLERLGHQVSIAANWGLQGAPSNWRGLTVHPADDRWGNDAITTIAEQENADAIVALCDAWVMHPDDWPDMRMAIWAPIDHYPIPPAVLATLGHDRVQPIAMSRFGEQLMRDFELDPVYVPHGIDTNLFKPQPELRELARHQLQIPQDAFVVGMVAANKGNPSVDRKGFDEAFQALARFMAHHDDVEAYVHTDATKTKTGGGGDLDVLARGLSIPETRLRFPGPKAWRRGIPRETVAVCYQAFDVLLAPSKGEGFGIPLLEAQACGVPVITSPHSAMRELGQNGWLIDGQPDYDFLQTSWFYQPFVKSIVEHLEAAYAERGTEAAAERSRRCVEFAHAYDADLVTDEYWRPALDRILGTVTESRQVRRARERKQAKRAKAAA